MLSLLLLIVNGNLTFAGSDFESPHMRPLAANGVPAVREPTDLATQAPPPPVQVTPTELPKCAMALSMSQV